MLHHPPPYSDTGSVPLSQHSFLCPHKAAQRREKGKITLPIVLWRIWAFVVPGLLKRERSWIPWLAAGSYVLFAAGAAAELGFGWGIHMSLNSRHRV